MNVIDQLFADLDSYPKTPPLPAFIYIDLTCNPFLQLLVTVSLGLQQTNS